MKQIEGLWWPDDVGEQWRHSLMHVGSLEWAIAHCRQHRTAIQAGGNVGLWPRRLAQVFDRVISFEPYEVSRACLVLNVPANVAVRSEALGATAGVCGIVPHKLGSHCIVPEGTDISVTTIDALQVDDLDLLQLDIEGYEWAALNGALETIQRCQPLIQVELRNHTTRYGHSDLEVRALLTSMGYCEVSRQQGSDVVFEAAA